MGLRRGQPPALCVPASPPLALERTKFSASPWCLGLVLGTSSVGHLRLRGYWMVGQHGPDLSKRPCHYRPAAQGPGTGEAVVTGICSTLLKPFPPLDLPQRHPSVSISLQCQAGGALLYAVYRKVALSLYIPGTGVDGHRQAQGQARPLQPPGIGHPEKGQSHPGSLGTENQNTQGAGFSSSCDSDEPRFPGLGPAPSHACPVLERLPTGP